MWGYALLARRDLAHKSNCTAKNPETETTFADGMLMAALLTETLWCKNRCHHLCDAPESAAGVSYFAGLSDK